MKWRALLIVAGCLVVSPAWAQTATNTPENTATPTQTPTFTPSPRGAFVDQLACPTQTPVCRSTPIKAIHHSYKTVALTRVAGSGNSTLDCVVTASHLAPTITLATMSGATCSTAANCIKGFWEDCEELTVGVPGGATVSAWLQMPPK